MSEQLPSAGIELSPDEIEPSTPGGHHPAGHRVRSRSSWPGSARPGTWPRAGRWTCSAAGSGRIWEDATPEVLAAVHQTWLRDPATGNYLLDVFREPHDGDTWICRRDEKIRLPYSDIIHHTQDGIPYLAPELVLLFKARHARRKDQADFDATVPHLRSTQRKTLAELLARAHPGHPWLADLYPPVSFGVG